MQKQKNCIKFYVSDILLRKKFRFGNNPMNKQTQVAIFMSAFMVNAEAMEPNIFSKEYQVHEKGYTIDHKHFEFVGDGTIPDIAQVNKKQKTSYYKRDMHFKKKDATKFKRSDHKNENFIFEEINIEQNKMPEEERFDGCNEKYKFLKFRGQGYNIKEIFFKEEALKGKTEPLELDLILQSRPGKKVSLGEKALSNLDDKRVKLKIICKIFEEKKSLNKKSKNYTFVYHYVIFPKKCLEMFLNSSSLIHLDLSGAVRANKCYAPKNRRFIHDINSLTRMCSGCINLEEVIFGRFNTRNIRDMSEMFYNCESLQNLDLHSFNTSRVTTMTRMFANCKRLKYVNISTFNTANVQKMDSMFLGCESLTNLNLRKIKTDQLETAFRMFYKCADLTTIVFGKGNLNTGKLKNISAMFEGCARLEYVDLSALNTNFVKYATNFVVGCKNLTDSEYHPVAGIKMRGIEHKCGIYIRPVDSDESEVEESDSEDI